MIDRELLPAAALACKANLHCHTTFSDGKLTTEQIRDAYRRQGYSVVAFTDHRHYGWYPELETEDFVPLAGFEADLNEPFPPSGSFDRVRTYHMNFYDTDPRTRGGFEAVQPPQRYGDTAAINQYVAQLKAQGFLACYNHPYWSLQSSPDYTGLQGFDFMEIYNHGCELDGMYGWHPQVYDEMLRAGQRLACVATDDNHNFFGFDSPRCDSFGGFTVLPLEKLGYGEVIAALQAGRFYASSGPVIHSLTLEKGKVEIHCSPCQRIYLLTQGRYTQSEIADPGQQMTSASFALTGEEGYFRLECRDVYDRRACTRAYFLTEFD